MVNEQLIQEYRQLDKAKPYDRRLKEYKDIEQKQAIIISKLRAELLTETCTALKNKGYNIVNDKIILNGVALPLKATVYVNYGLNNIHCGVEYYLKGYGMRYIEVNNEKFDETVKTEVQRILDSQAEEKLLDLRTNELHAFFGKERESRFSNTLYLKLNKKEGVWYSQNDIKITAKADSYYVSTNNLSYTFKTLEEVKNFVDKFTIFYETFLAQMS